MNLPFEYDRLAVGEFGGTTPTTTDFEHARVVILPVPLDRTTSYVPGTRNGPHEILVASSHMELWDEETETDVHSIGIFTLPEMEFPFATMDEVMREIRRVASEIVVARQVSVRARRRALDHGAGRRRRWRRSTRACRCCRSTRTPTCASRSWARRTTTRARCGACSSTRARRRSASAACRRKKRPRRRRCRPTIFYDFNMRQDDDWIERVVDSLGETVYITIDCDGLDPAIMPAVGTPEPGGLTWYETLALLRRVIESRQRRRLRHRRALPPARQRRAELPLREADLQDPVVPVRRARSNRPR